LAVAIKDRLIRKESTGGVVFLLFFYNRVSGVAIATQDSLFFFCLFPVVVGGF